jgi:hemoglobin-like flavoprotein
VIDAAVNHRLRASFAALAAAPDAFARGFYARLFAIDPSLAALFPADLADQRSKLVDMFASIIDALDHPDTLAATFSALGRRHVGYGVEEMHYDLVGSALLGALRDSLGQAWSEDVEEAWATLYGAMAEAMIEAAADVGHAD